MSDTKLNPFRKLLGRLVFKISFMSAVYGDWGKRMGTTSHDTPAENMRLKCFTITFPIQAKG